MYFAGIDIAKRQHRAVVLDSACQVVVKPFSFANNRAGIEQLLTTMSHLDQPVGIGLEATGHYWLVVFDQLTQAGHTVHVLNPLQVHAYQQSGIRKRKTDTIDAIWIADFVRIGGAELRSDASARMLTLQLRQLTRFHFNLTDQIGDIKRQILGILDRVFPEYEQFFSHVFITTSRQLLAEAIMPQDFLNFDLHELEALIQKASRGRLSRDKAQEIQLVARQSVGIRFLADAARVQMGCLLAQLAFLEQQVLEVDAAVEQLVAQLPQQYLTTIPGIGPLVAATLLAEIGDIQRFDSVEQLAAYAGIDPATFQSGQFNAKQTHMSKRGSPYLRRALWLGATLAKRFDPDLRDYYHKRRAEGQPHGVVMGAVCRKLLNRAYVVLKQQRPYRLH